MEKIVNSSCKQFDLFKRERFFELFNEQYLRVVKKDKKQTKEFVVELISLLPGSLRVTKISWYWLMSTIGFLLISAGIIYYLIQNFTWGDAVYFIPMSLLTVLLAVSSMYLLLFTSERKQVFYTTYSGYPLIEILVSKPDKKEFNEFIEEVNKKITQVLEKNTLSVNNLQAGEMKMLRRLCVQGVLSHDEYEQAKVKIFNFIDSEEVLPSSLDDAL